MGIFDFLKQKKPAVTETRKIKLDETREFISKKKQELSSKEADAVKVIKSEIKSLGFEFETEISAIKRIDLKERKVEERIRLIVLENAHLFSSHVEKLKENLENIKSGSLPEVIKILNADFQEFKKNLLLALRKRDFLSAKSLEM